MLPAQTPPQRHRRFPVIRQLQARGRVAGVISEQRLTIGGGNTRAPARRPGGRAGLERRLDGGGDQLRGLGVDGDVAAEQHAADDLASVRGQVCARPKHPPAVPPDRAGLPDTAGPHPGRGPGRPWRPHGPHPEAPPAEPGHPLAGLQRPCRTEGRAYSGPRLSRITDPMRTKGRVRFWEQNGSGGPLLGSVGSGDRARPDAADVQKRPITAALPSCALSSHRGGQGFKSPQLHREVFTFRWGLFSRLPPTFWRAGWRRCPCRLVAGFGCLLGGLLCAGGGSGHAAACGASRVIVVRAWRWLPR